MAVEKINRIISKTPEYIKWLRNLDNEVTDDLEILLYEANPEADEESLEWLNRHVLVTLFCAKEYSSENDIFNRNFDEEFKTLGSQLKRIAKFNELIKEDPDFGIRFYLQACLPMNSPGKVLFNIPKGQYDSILKTMFGDYEKSLQKGISMLREYEQMEWVGRGGLFYRQFNSNGKKVVIQDIEFDSKLFHLTFIFKHFTLGKLDLGIEAKKMPKIGKPRYDLTAKILKIKQQDVKQHVRRLVQKDVHIKQWYIPELAFPEVTFPHSINSS